MSTMDLSGAESGAVLSPCELYRYTLTRRWAEGPTMLFVMLNPSTADASQDDPTIRRCRAFAHREGCGALEVVNLFSYRATNPKDLSSTAHPLNGPESNAAIVRAVTRASIVVAAWGAWTPESPPRRQGDVLAMVGRPVLALGVTSNGQPRHPLYVRGDAPLITYEVS